MASPTRSGSSRTVKVPSALTVAVPSWCVPFASSRTAVTFSGSAGAGPSHSSRPRTDSGSPATAPEGLWVRSPVKRVSYWAAGGWMTCSQYSWPVPPRVTAKSREPSSDQARPRGVTPLPSRLPSKANSSGGVPSAGSALCTSRSGVLPAAWAPRAMYLPSPLKATAVEVAPAGRAWYWPEASDRSPAFSSRVPAVASATATLVPSGLAAMSARSRAPLPSASANRREASRTGAVPLTSNEARKGFAAPLSLGWPMRRRFCARAPGASWSRPTSFQPARETVPFVSMSRDVVAVAHR